VSSLRSAILTVLVEAAAEKGITVKPGASEAAIVRVAEA
jgi:hypothetical protein